MDDKSRQKVIQLNEYEHLLDTASVWLVRMDEGLDSTQKIQLKQWLEQPRHRAVLLEMAALWDKMDALSQLAELFPASPGKPQRTRQLAPWAAAATVIVVLLAGFGGFEWLTPDRPAVLQVNKLGVFTTPVGQFREVTLPDGSRLWLNTDSAVDVTYTANQRVLQLHRGELHIEVAKDASRPLSVLANGQQIQAVGTAFSVQLSASEVNLLVTEGRVRVANSQANTEQLLHRSDVQLPATAAAVSMGDNTRLTAAGPEQPIRITPAELEARLAWRTGKLIFRGELLKDVLAQVSRYTTWQFQIPNEDLARQRVAGLFYTQDVPTMLDALATNFALKFDYQEGNTVVVSRS